MALFCAKCARSFSTKQAFRSHPCFLRSKRPMKLWVAENLQKEFEAYKKRARGGEDISAITFFPSSTLKAAIESKEGQKARLDAEKKREILRKEERREKREGRPPITPKRPKLRR